ncbi:MAG: threonyl-tRNA synthetase [Bacillales bacterium]|jgi:threonyl-tRNA synthetase|nr:threonyl-tRNA synthetase [Bacillales bacterium]
MAEIIKITFPDGAVKEFPKGISTEEIAGSISPGLRKKAVAGKVNGQILDVYTPINEDADFAIITQDNVESLEILRHSSAHILAQAIKRLYPEVKLGIGPVIENGFYYDIDMETSLTPEDLPLIEKEMQKIINENIDIRCANVSRDEALDRYKAIGDDLKIELINDLPEDQSITIYEQGEFFDLCRGTHLASTGKLKAFKLLSIAGAYWRGDSNNKMLQRVYGTAFWKKEELDAHLHMLEEAKKRDHRKLGKELELFAMMEEGPGFPFMLPKGMIIRNLLEGYWREVHKKAGYDEIKTPIMLNRQLWETSGHWFNYRENMYTSEIDEEQYAIKPMNCPGSVLVYRNTLHSYRDFPLRYGELGLVHRHEFSGALHGLMRVRSFTQDDAHIFMTKDQITEEIVSLIELIDKFYKSFGFEYFVELSTRPEKSMGSDEDWEVATDGLREALEEAGLAFKINEGDGAFYGPKIDFHLRDCIGRTWQCGTIQLDFQLPERFDLTYIGPDGEKHRPVMLHRVVFGSIERFMGILIEHFAGAFPTWLAPVQVKVIPVSADVHLDYAKKVLNLLGEKGFRAELDGREEKIGYKIREAQVAKIPFMIVLGDKEVDSDSVNVRRYGEQNSEVMSIVEFVELLEKESKNY